jgi:hypothetical protein
MADYNGNGTGAGRTQNGAGNGTGKHSNGSGNGHAGTADHNGFDDNPEETEGLREQYRQSKKNPWGDEGPLVCEQLEPLPITSIPPRPWAYSHFLLFGAASVLGAVDGGGKGAHAVAIALAMITGRPLLGEHVWRTGPVAIITYEDDKTEWRRRIAVACLHYGIDYDSVCRSFYFISRPRGRIRLAAQSALGRGATVMFPDGDAIIEKLRAIKAVLLIVDPFNHAHTLEDGNSNVMVAQLASEIARIAAESMVAALVLHHLRKGSTGNADDLMGAVMLRATFRAARILVRMTSTEAEELKVPAAEAWRYSRIASSKENYAPPPDRATWYKFESVKLANGTELYPDGDSVQVVTPWTPPSAFEGLQKTKIAEIFAALRTGPGDGEFYASDPRATYWAGHVIEASTGKTEKEAKRILRNWCGNQVLLEDEYYSEKRKRTVPRVTVNDAKARDILGRLYQPPEADA